MDFLKQNAVSLIIAAMTLTSTYAVYGYRLGAVEARLDRQGEAIVTLQSNMTQIQISLATIQSDIGYIKAQIDRVPK